MRQKALEYCLKVWVTAVVAGPLFYYVMDKASVDGLLSFPEFMFVSVMGGLLLSVPIFVALCATTVYICKRPGSQAVQRLKLAGWSLLFIVISMEALAFLLGDDWTNTDWFIVIRFFASYFGSVLVAIYVYHLPAAQPKALTPSSDSSPD